MQGNKAGKCTDSCRSAAIQSFQSLSISTRSNLGQILNWLLQERSNTINFGKGPSGVAAANLVYSFKELPSLASRSNAIADVFLVAVEPGLASIYEMNWIAQPYAFKASNFDPDTLSYENAMTDVDRELWIEAAKKRSSHCKITEPGLKSTSRKPIPRFYLVNGYFDPSVPHMEALSPAKLEWWQDAIWNRESSNPSLRSS